MISFVWHPDLHRANKTNCVSFTYRHDHRIYSEVYALLKTAERNNQLFKVEKKAQHDLLSALPNVRRQAFATTQLTPS